MLTKAPEDAVAVTSADQTFLFHYSEQEWSEIEAATQSIAKNRLLKETYDRLVAVARMYLAERAHQTLGQERRAWQKIALQAESLRRAISALLEEHVRLLKNSGATRESQAALRRHWDQDFGVVSLSKIRNSARKMAVLHKKGTIEDFHYRNPKMNYEMHVLSVWTDLGGKLRLSRHPKTGQIQGPLARFFRAVTAPVMGVSAPSPESLPDIVRRQKRRVASEISRSLDHVLASLGKPPG